MYNGTTLLHIFERKSVISQWYCRKIILDHVCLFMGVIGSDFLFIDNNMCPHSSTGRSSILNEDINHLQWGLNLIQHAWNVLDRSCRFDRPADLTDHW